MECGHHQSSLTARPGRGTCVKVWIQGVHVHVHVTRVYYIQHAAHTHTHMHTHTHTQGSSRIPQGRGRPSAAVKEALAAAANEEQRKVLPP